jgi:hypothetical protein
MPALSALVNASQRPDLVARSPVLEGRTPSTARSLAHAYATSQASNPHSIGAATHCRAPLPRFPPSRLVGRLPPDYII